MVERNRKAKEAEEKEAATAPAPAPAPIVATPPPAADIAPAEADAPVLKVKTIVFLTIALRLQILTDICYDYFQLILSGLPGLKLFIFPPFQFYFKNN